MWAVSSLAPISSFNTTSYCPSFKLYYLSLLSLFWPPSSVAPVLQPHLDIVEAALVFLQLVPFSEVSKGLCHRLFWLTFF